MANWCNNIIDFEGKPEAIEQIQQLFETMAKKAKVEEIGQLPDFVTQYNGYFFNIYWNEGDIGFFQCQTKWLPNLEIVREIAEYYKVNFVSDYEEMGNLIYGRAIFSDKLLTDIYLENEDFEKYQFDEQTDTYHFEGKEYECDYEILEILLERKTVNPKY